MSGPGNITHLMFSTLRTAAQGRIDMMGPIDRRELNRVWALSDKGLVRVRAGGYAEITKKGAAYLQKREATKE